MNVLLDLSPLTTGAVSAARAVSSGIGLAFGADAGAVRERDAAVRCSAVCHQPISAVNLPMPGVSYAYHKPQYMRLA